MIFQIRKFLEALLADTGMNEDWCVRLAQITIVLGILLLFMLLAYGLRRFLVPPILRIVEKTETKWDDYLINRPVLNAASQLVPSIMVYSLLPFCFDSQESTMYVFLSRLTQVYITACAAYLITSFLRNVTTVAAEKVKEHHLVGVLQFLRLVIVCFALIVIICQLFGYNPIRFIAGLGAAATVLMLIFKDSILGLVVGIQLSLNKMLKVGDWITIQDLNIDGFVEEISLTTVKVRNFDNTISTVPPYNLISGSFQNWNAMAEAGARRVKRAFYIDLQSVRFVTKEELEFLKRKKFITKEEAESEEVTNLTLFRRCVARRLKANKTISDKQWTLVRQLAPTPNGLPIELWFYSLQTEFVSYEDFAAEQMEQFIALVPEFKLRLFQSPTGHDLHILKPSE